MSHFENVGGVVIGDDILKGRGRRDEVTGFLKAIKESPEDVEIIPLISVFGLAGGNISAEAVRFLEKILREGLREAGRLDGILFAFEGAMASADIPDLDTHFLRIARAETGETVPFVCALNCHAILTRQMVDLSSAIVAYRTHPHEDVVETGWRAGDILLRILTGKINPVME